jgi:hypothetical protein
MLDLLPFCAGALDSEYIILVSHLSPSPAREYYRLSEEAETTLLALEKVQSIVPLLSSTSFTPAALSQAHRRARAATSSLTRTTTSPASLTGSGRRRYLQRAPLPALSADEGIFVKVLEDT